MSWVTPTALLDVEISSLSITVSHRAMTTTYISKLARIFPFTHLSRTLHPYHNKHVMINPLQWPITDYLKEWELFLLINVHICNDFIDTIEDIYIQCEHTRHIWNDTEKWLREIKYSHFKISDIEKSFGCMDHNKTTQLIIFTVKM